MRPLSIIFFCDGLARDIGVVHEALIPSWGLATCVYDSTEPQVFLADAVKTRTCRYAGRLSILGRRSDTYLRWRELRILSMYFARLSDLARTSGVSLQSEELGSAARIYNMSRVLISITEALRCTVRRACPTRKTSHLHTLGSTSLTGLTLVLSSAPWCAVRRRDCVFNF